RTKPQQPEARARASPAQPRDALLWRSGMPDDHITDDSGSPPQRRRDEDYERDPRDRYGDDLDVSRPRRSELGWLDRQFLDTSIVVLVIFSLCCGIIAFAFGLAGFIACKDPEAKQKAMITMIVGGVMAAIGVAIRFAAVASKM